MKFKNPLIYCFSIIGVVSYFLFLAFLGRSVETSFFYPYLDIYWIALIAIVLSYVISRRVQRNNEKANKWKAFLYAAFIFQFITIGLNIYGEYRWDNFFKEVKKENSYNNLSYANICILQKFDSMAVALSKKYGSNYKIKFTTGLPNNVYGLTWHKDKTLYFNRDIFLDFKEGTGKRVDENYECVLHEISHVLYQKKYKDMGGHNMKWCELAKKMGVDTRLYETLNKSPFKKVLLKGDF